jgi:uncharacterized Zn finger protein
VSPGRRNDRWSDRRWEDWPPSAPLAVEGGLTARSARGAIGRSWWSKRFIAVLESFGAGGRLTRGRAYARKGQVLSLDLVPGVVSGSVQGSRPAPYEVWITMPVLPPAVWQKVETAVAEQALFAAQLLGGELPAELEDVVTAAGGRLFPQSFGDLSMRCTCPDWGMPCKHLAAAFYLLAETFDDDPFRILLWRGRSREQVLAGIGDGAPGTGPGARDDVPVVSAAAELADLPAADVTEQLDRFWVSPVPLPPRPPTLEAPVDVLVRQLPGPPATLGGATLATELTRTYHRLAPLSRDQATSPCGELLDHGRIA